MRERIGLVDGISVKLHRDENQAMEDMLIKGRVEAVLFGPDGQVKQRETHDNLIVTQGKYGIADRLLASPTIGVPTHMGIGTGAVAPAAGDTTLGAEVGTRGAFSAKTRNNNVVTMVASFAAGNGTGAITEAGIFNASSAGTMFSRVTFSVINKGANDTLELTWTYTIG